MSKLICYEETIKSLRERFFDKYGVKPIKTHEDCPHYEYIKGWDVCNKKEDNNSPKCTNCKKVYPDITAEQLIELIAIASGYFKISFAFERGYDDVEENVLESLCNYDDLQGGVKRDVQHLFKV